MAKNKRQHLKSEADFLLEPDYLWGDYNNALDTIEQQKKDIRRLLAILIENGLPVPDEMIDRYIQRVSGVSSTPEEELPFD